MRDLHGFSFHLQVTKIPISYFRTSLFVYLYASGKVCELIKWMDGWIVLVK